MKRLYYIAYGSNINVEQMMERCPTARVYGVSRIPDYRLIFKALDSCAYATIEPCKGAFVPVLVWMILENDERNLDEYEVYPDLYGKDIFKVMLGEQEVEGMIYIMNDKAVPAAPEKKYFDSILSGYRSFCLPESVLCEARFAFESSEPLILNLDKLHTTDLGIERIKRNLCLDVEDVVRWCKEKIECPGSRITRKGKNWYVIADGASITVNAYSYTIITAHRKKL